MLPFPVVEVNVTRLHAQLIVDEQYRALLRPKDRIGRHHLAMRCESPARERMMRIIGELESEEAERR